MTFRFTYSSKYILSVILHVIAVSGGIAATLLDNVLMFGIVTFLFASSGILLIIKRKMDKIDSNHKTVLTSNISELSESGSTETVVSRSTPDSGELTDFIDNMVRKKIEIIPVLAEQLKSVINQTDEAAGGLIQAFMGISKQAKKQQLTVQELFGNLSEQTDNDNILSQTSENLREIQINFSTLTSFFDKSILMMNEVVGKLTKVDEVASKIEQIQKMTNILAINASIQAAHSGDAGSGFKVIASEINDLSKKSNSSINEITQTTDELTLKVNAIKRELESVCQESKNIGLRTDKLFNQTTEKISSKLADTAEKIKGVASDAESLTKEISKAVVSIQFQDITRQQLEHVISPLEAISIDFKKSMDEFKEKGFDFRGNKKDSMTIDLMDQYTMESEREILRKIKNSKT